MTEAPLQPGINAFPLHVFNLFGEEPRVLEQRIGGTVMVAAKRGPHGPLTLITAGASRLPVDQGQPVELAVEVADGQEGAALVALQLVCNDIATNRRTPPLESPWRNPEPFLKGTQISAIVATGSRWGELFDDVKDESGAVVGHVRTLRLLTSQEADVAASRGWSGLVTAAGSIDALLDVHRATTVESPARDLSRMPIVASKLHEQHPPRWLTLRDNMFQSVTGHESPEYMADKDNHQVVPAATYARRFPWTVEFLETAEPGQTARFEDASGAFTLEER